MVGIAAQEPIVREPGVHLVTQALQQLIDLQDGVVAAVTGVCGGDLLIADQQKGAGLVVQSKAGVEHFR